MTALPINDLMLMYPDARDLINLFKGIPVSVVELREILQATNSQLVLSFENVSEIVLVNDPPQTRNRLRALETLPIRYMLALPQLRCHELTIACEVFLRKTPIAADPFVHYWEETFGFPHRNVLTYSLTDVVMELLHKNSKLFRKTERDTDLMASAVREDRNVDDRERRSIERFRGGIQKSLRRCGITLPDTREFALWVNEDPSRCPALWFFGRVYLDFAGNVAAEVQPGDYMDLSHAARLPYVDALTLDRRTKAYAEQAVRRLSTEYPNIDYSRRLFLDLSEVLRAL